MGWLEETRASYDTVAGAYQPLVWAMFEAATLEQTMLSGFASLVIADGGGPVVDVGCGPGDVTAHLRDLGLDITGIDISERMLAVATRNHPELDFRTGDLTALDLPDGQLAGAVSWWSTVHLPPAVLPTVFGELQRVLAPGGRLLVGFHAGAEVRHRTEAYGGLPVSLDIYLRPPEELVAAATVAGLDVTARLLVDRTGPTAADQCCLLFRKPV